MPNNRGSVGRVPVFSVVATNAPGVPHLATGRDRPADALPPPVTSTVLPSKNGSARRVRNHGSVAAETREKDVVGSLDEFDQAPEVLRCSRSIDSGVIKAQAQSQMEDIDTSAIHERYPG